MEASIKKISMERICEIISSVGKESTLRKERLSNINSSNYDISGTLKWYRKRKNIDLKDALTFEGLNQGFSVRAEKTMGALPEYGSRYDEKNRNRFDLSWEKEKGTKEFSLVVEIEMDVDVGSIMQDFKKLLANQCPCLKVMICQAKKNDDMKRLMSEVKNHLDKADNLTGNYLWGYTI